MKRMRKPALFLMICCFALAGIAGAQTLGAVLTGAAEAPGPGDEDGFGHSTVVFSEDRTMVTITASVGGIATPTAAHIHIGPAGEPGGVVVGFAGGALGAFMNGVAVTVPVDPVLAGQILANPAGYYVNVHNADFPGGAIRGQLSSAGGTLFGGDLLGGDREIPPGDPDGGGAFLITLDDTRTSLSYDVLVTDIGSITNSHIHTGAEGVAGGVLVGLVTESATFVDGRLRGTITIPAETGDAIAANPAGFYVNVHTTDFPGGAVRGQLGSVHEVVLPVVGRVAGSGGELFVTDIRVFNPSYADTITVLFEFFPSGMTSLIAGTSSTFTIPPRGTRVLDDAIFNLLGTTGIGWARLTSTGAIVATSRIFDDRRAAGEGTIGQFLPGLPRSRALRNGVLTQLADTSAAHSKGSFRTNVGLVNPNASPVTVRLELRDADGAVIAERTLTLGPMMHSQQGLATQWFSLPPIDHPDMTLTFSASSPIFAYASILDNVTSDPVAVIAEEDPGTPQL